MPFPITIGSEVFATPRDLAAEVLRRAIAGKRPDGDIARAAETGTLSRDEALGLCAALIQTGRPQAVVVGARLAQKLGDKALCRLLLLAHEALDMGTLLQAADEATSVEDLLLSAAATVLDDDAELRQDLLTRVRHAGLGGVETRVLAQHGTAEEITSGLTGVMLEGLPPDTANALALAMQRGEDVANAILTCTASLNRSDRTVLWTAMTRHGAHRSVPELKERLFPDSAP